MSNRPAASGRGYLTLTLGGVEWVLGIPRSQTRLSCCPKPCCIMLLYLLHSVLGYPQW